MAMSDRTNMVWAGVAVFVLVFIAVRGSRKANDGMGMAPGSKEQLEQIVDPSKTLLEQEEDILAELERRISGPRTQSKEHMVRMALSSLGVDHNSEVGKKFLARHDMLPKTGPGTGSSSANLSTATGGFALPKEPNPGNQPPPATQAPASPKPPAELPPLPPKKPTPEPYVPKPGRMAFPLQPKVKPSGE